MQAIEHSALDRLQAMVEKAQTRRRKNRLATELTEAGERLAKLWAKTQAFLSETQRQLVTHQAELQAAEEGERRLRDHVQALSKLHADMDHEDRAEAERLVDQARGDLLSKKRRHQEEIQRLKDLTTLDLTEVWQAIGVYQRLRGDFAAHPVPGLDVTRWDAAVREISLCSPQGRVRHLAEEIRSYQIRDEGGSCPFEAIPKREQYFLLKFWIGSLRLCQSEFNSLPPDEITPDDDRCIQGIFPLLTSMSKHYQVGFIEAFALHFTTQWPEYVDGARRALEACRAEREARNGQVSGEDGDQGPGPGEYVRGMETG